jgi:hypothetical protein
MLLGGKRLLVLCPVFVWECTLEWTTSVAAAQQQIPPQSAVLVSAFKKKLFISKFSSFLT